MGGTSNDDTVSMQNAGKFSQWDLLSGWVAGEVINQPDANHWEAALGSSTFDSLQDGSPTTLSDFGGPVTGDATFAWQWDMTISSGESFQISKDKMITPIPEPNLVLLLGCGLTGLVGYARLKRKRKSSVQKNVG